MVRARQMQWDAAMQGYRPARRRQRVPVGLMAACAAAATALLVLVLLPRRPAETPQMQVVPAAAPAVEAAVFALPDSVIRGLPSGETSYTVTFPAQRLMNGRMLLVDDNHPVPAELMPNTTGILARSGGRVACRDTTAVLAPEAIDALDDLFRHARYARHNTLVVFAAARSGEQQRSDLIDRMTALSRSMSFEAALAQAKREIELPGCSEHQLPWSVDIRICDAWNALPSGEALSASAAGRWVLAHCWEYGFIQRYPQAADDSHRAWHFRYVGKGHAAMMRALDVPLEEYLLILREYGVLTLMDDAGQPAVTVVCQPMAQARETRMSLPLHGTVEDVSADNDGWAMASCLYQ